MIPALIRNSDWSLRWDEWCSFFTGSEVILKRLILPSCGALFGGSSSGGAFSPRSETTNLIKNAGGGGAGAGGGGAGDPFYNRIQAVAVKTCLQCSHGGGSLIKRNEGACAGRCLTWSWGCHAFNLQCRTCTSCRHPSPSVFVTLLFFICSVALVDIPVHQRICFVTELLN